MDYKYIDQLLERYFDCETTLHEESILRTFFAQNDVPAHLKQYQMLFEAEQMDSKEHLSDDFDERVLSMIHDEEKETPVVKAQPLRLTYQFRPFFKAAAIVAIILSFSLSVQMAMYQSQEPTADASAPTTIPLAQETNTNNEGLVARPDSLAQYTGDVPSGDVVIMP